MSLYQKHRPTNLKQIRGNKETVAALSDMLKKVDNCPHAFLLTGATGCGKTTLARIIASELGAKGGDLKEVDSADFRGIETIRNIRKNSGYAPMEGKVRVWIMDEVHKLTNDAQNAILKILEDTPKHVFFILCTTDPQGLLPTIKNRCSQFIVSKLEKTEMLMLLNSIVEVEKFKVKKKALDVICDSAQGHPRAAIMLLDQISRLSKDEQVKAAQRFEEGQVQVIELCRLLINGGNWKGISAVLKQLKEQKEDAENIRRVVLGYCTSVLLKSDMAKAGLVMDFFIEPFYNSGFPGLVHACYSIYKS